MPFPRTWSEELIAEWLELCEYFVETGVPLPIKKKGGRAEADIIGVKIDTDLEIYHIEVGSLRKASLAEEDIREKFSDYRRDLIIKHIKKKLGYKSDKVNYKTLFIAVWVSNKTLERLKKMNLPVVDLFSFINDNIRPAIQKWKIGSSLREVGDSNLTLPSNLWMLYLLDYITPRPALRARL